MQKSGTRPTGACLARGTCADGADVHAHVRGLPRPRDMRVNISTIGATEGSIIAAIIVTQIPRYQPTSPRSVPGPVSIPCIRLTVTIHATRAPARSTAAIPTGLTRAIADVRSSRVGGGSATLIGRL